MTNEFAQETQSESQQTENPAVGQPQVQNPENVESQEREMESFEDIAFNDIDPEDFKHFAADPNEPFIQDLEELANKNEPQDVPQPQEQQNVSQPQVQQPKVESPEVAALKARLEVYENLIPQLQQNMQPQGHEEEGSNGQFELTPPTPPVKPRDFNYEEAQMDDKSASAQYLRDFSEYQQKQAEYLQAMNERILTQQQEMVRQRQMQQQMEADKMAWRDKLAKKGFQSHEIELFLNEMYSPQSINEENIVRLFLINHPDVLQRIKGSTKRRDIVQEKLKNIQRKPLSTIANISGQTEKAKSEEQLFSDSLGATSPPNY